MGSPFLCLYGIRIIGGDDKGKPAASAKKKTQTEIFKDFEATLDANVRVYILMMHAINP